MSQACRYFKIHGKVQGVFFRANTEKKANALSITGWVRNTEDGCVECVGCGSEDNLELFAQWLAQGPEAAVVDHVDSQAQDYQIFKSFDIRY